MFSKYSARLIFVLFTFVLLLKDLAHSHGNRNENSDVAYIDVDSPHAVKSAEFAVKELSKLSDSGIYTSLELAGIVSAALQDGIFHNNTLLMLDLSSPHFKSKKLVERFNMIVMIHKQDGVKAIAIDEFPEMDEDAIEEYYIRKIEQKRRDREAAFRRIELENYFFRKNNNFRESEESLNADVKSLKDEIRGKTIEDLLQELDSDAGREKRRKNSEEGIQIRLKGEHLADEQELQKLNLSELFAIVTDQRPASDYQKFRAQTLLDIALRSI